MRKKSKYKPRPVLTDPVAYVVESSTLLVDHGTYVIDWKLKLHVAMEMLVKGVAKKPHMDAVVAARNITEGLMVVLDGTDVDGTLLRSGAALMDVCDRANAGKGTTLRAPEMQALRDMTALHDELLDVVTVGQMEKAMAYIKKEINAGKASVLKDVSNSTKGESEMQVIQQREFNRAIAVLEALGCEYKIITKDGEEFGELELTKAQSRSPNRYPYGTLTNYARTLMDFDLKPGDVHSIPAGDYDPKVVQRVTCSMLSKAWGLETYTTAVSGDHVDVMRIRS